MSISYLQKVPQKDRRAVYKEMRVLIEELRDLRRTNKITQEALADQMGVSVETLRKIENGQQNPSFPMFLRFARALGVKLTLS